GRQGARGRIDGAAEVDVARRLPLVPGELCEGRPDTVDAGVGGDGVGAVPFPDDGVHGPFHGLGVRNIRDASHSRTAGLFDGFDGGVELFFGTPESGDARAFLSETQRGSAADAGAGSGD